MTYTEARTRIDELEAISQAQEARLKKLELEIKSIKVQQEIATFFNSIDFLNLDTQEELIKDFYAYLASEYPEAFTPIDFTDDCLSNYYTHKPQKIFVDSVAVDSLDLTGLDAADARALAGAINSWQYCKSGKVYSWRNGRRYLAKGITTLQVNHPLVESLGLNLSQFHHSEFSYA